MSRCKQRNQQGCVHYSGVLISRTGSTVLTAAQSGRVFVSEGHVRLIKRLGCGAVCSFITTNMQIEQLLTVLVEIISCKHRENKT